MENADLITYLVTPFAQVALIVALAEVVKRMGLFDNKYIPVVDLVLGLIAGYLVYVVYKGYHPIEGLMIGVALGLSACGLFSGIKNVMEK